MDRIKQLAPQHPEWNNKEPFASVLKGDIKGAFTGGERALFDLGDCLGQGLGLAVDGGRSL